jgi:outer membrane lipoprotein-sorting protein
MLMLALSAVLGLSTPSYAEEEIDVIALLDKTDDMSRGTSSHAVMTMAVKTARYERTVKMETWSQGTERSLVVILEPAKEKGVATLMVDDNIWNYLPKVDRTMKVPAAMMSGSWMGSHVTNDDLVKGSRMSEDYTFTLDEQPTNGQGRYLITLIPKPDAPVVWGKVTVELSPDELPTRMEFFEEDGTLVRVMKYEDVREVSGKKMPMVFVVEPADKPGEFTRMEYTELEFDVDIPESKFSLQALKN